MNFNSIPDEILTLKSSIMKSKFLGFLLILSVFNLQQYSASAQSIHDLVGEWNAEAPDAPAGFNTSIMKITADSVFTTFTGETYSYGSTSVNYKNDTLSFVIGGLGVLCTLKLENKGKLSGNAVWDEGESRLFLTKKEQLSNDQ
jgi:hypothetical protein